MFQSRDMDSTLCVLKRVLQASKSLSILIVCVYALNRNKHIITSFCISNMRYIAPDLKLKLHVHLTKSSKRDNISKLCLYMVAELLILVT